MSLINDATVDLETVDCTIAACAWLVDVAERSALTGGVDAAAAARWLEGLGSRLHMVRSVQQMNTVHQVPGVLQ